MPTNHWHDLLHHAHDRAFVVAGATRDALIEDFQAAIDDALAKGLPFNGWLDKAGVHQPGFIDRFDEIVRRHGWDHKGGREWRARVIYETNLKSAHAAGRYRQMTDPDVLKVYPYWEYVHGLARVPDTPREDHEAWSGLVLPADDPWWQTYYPPNGWKCGCGVRPVSRAKLKTLGKDGPDPSPPIETERRPDPATGQILDYPKGVDMGWAYAPGRSWASGLVPRELQQPLGKQMQLPGLDQLPELRSFSKPLSKHPLPTGQSEATYVDAFLSEFNAAREEPALYRDVAGHAIVISDELFKTATGKSKLNSSRAAHLNLQAEALKDPDEIWLDWEWHKEKRKWILKRRYMRALKDLAGMLVFEWSQTGWRGTTVYNAESGKKGKRRPNYNQLESWRHGALIYRRPENENGG